MYEKTNLNFRFKNLKKQCLQNNYKFGKFWEKEKKTFEVNFRDGNFYSTGSRNYLPRIYNKDIKDKDIILIDSKKFIQIAKKKFCVLKKDTSRHFLHSYHFFKKIKDLIVLNDICLDIGSGSGLIQFLIHQDKKGTNIFIDIPESILNSVALCFTLFPNSKIILPNEIKENNLNIKDYDFIFLYPNQKHLIKNSSINFGINTQSFQEMDIGEVNAYLKYFNRVLINKSNLFISNRILKNTYFFSYNFKGTNYKKIYLKKDNYYYSKENSHLSSFINLLLQKNNKHSFAFNKLDYIFGFLYLKNLELIFWIKFYMKNLIIYFLRKFKLWKY